MGERIWVIMMGVFVFGIFGFAFSIIGFDFGVTGFAVFWDSVQGDFDGGVYVGTEWNGSAVVLSGGVVSGLEVVVGSDIALLMHMNEVNVSTSVVFEDDFSDVVWEDRYTLFSGVSNQLEVVNGVFEISNWNTNKVAVNGLDVDNYTYIVKMACDNVEANYDCSVIFNYGDSSSYLQYGNRNGVVRIFDEVNNVLISGSSTILDDVYYWYKVSVSSDGILARHWADGESEPLTWEFEIANDVLRDSGSVGFSVHSLSKSYVDDLSVSATFAVVEDVSSGGSDGVYVGDSSVAAGQMGGAVVFDGVDDYLSVDDVGGFDFSKDYSMQFWVKPASGVGQWTYFMQKEGQFGFQLVAGDLLKFHVPGYAEVTSDVAIVRGDWNHVLVSLDDSSDGNDYIRVYLNGQLSGNLGPTWGAPASTSFPIYFGVSSSLVDYFESSFDEVVVWDRVLSDAEVLAVYEGQIDGVVLSGSFESRVFDAGSDATWNNLSWVGSAGGELSNGGVGSLMAGNVLLMHMNEGAGIIKDTSGENNDGVYNGALYSQSGKLSTSIGFDGNGDCVSLTSSPISPSGNYAVSLWYNSNDVATFSMLLSYYEDGAAADPAPEIRFTSGEVIARISNEADTDFVISYATEINVWHHVTITKDSNDFLLYYDGSQVDSTTLSGIIVTPQYFRIGCRNYGSGDVNSINGTIDELAIWNRALSLDEVSEIYQRGVLRLNLTARSCGDANCSSESYVDIVGDSPLNLSLGNNTYFQYKFLFDTDDSSYSPELYNTSVDYSILNSAPSIVLISPEDKLYDNGSLELRYNVVDDNLDSCWYKVDGDGVVLLNGCLNVTLNISGGVHNLTVYANDSFGEVGSASVDFRVDIVGVDVILSEPVGVKSSRIGIGIEYVVSGVESCWYNVETSIGGSVIENTSLVGCNGSSFNVSADGDYVLNLFGNNSLGSFDFDSSSFSVDSSEVVPVVVVNGGGSSGGGGGGGSYSVAFAGLEVEPISVVASVGEEKSLSVSVKNVGRVAANKCRLVGDVESGDMFNIGAGEIVEFAFVLSVSDNLVDLKVECLDNVSEDVVLDVVVLKNDLDVSIDGISFGSEDELLILYSVEAFSDGDVLFFRILNSVGGVVAETEENLVGLSGEVLIDISGVSEGMLKIVVGDGSEVSFVEEEFIYDGGLTGFALFGSSGSANYFNIAIFVFLILGCVLGFRVWKLRKGK